MNFLFQLGRNFRQKVRPDSVEEEIVFAGLVDLVHLLVQVVVHARDGVDLRRQLVHLLVDAWKQVLKTGLKLVLSSLKEAVGRFEKGC